VWFFGTANHDETTNELADKTYERAHVLELPREPEPFRLHPPRASRDPIAVAALLDAFARSRAAHPRAARQCYEYLRREVGPVLHDDFGIGITPRLERQLEAFVPVVLDAGGTIGEATDHVLATRLLRKIRGRHEARPRRYEALAEALEKRWLDRSAPASASLALVRRELDRHRGTDVGEEP